MGYLILILTIAVYLIRPAEWIPALYFNWNMVLNGLGLIAIAGIAINKNKASSYDRTTLFLIWFICSMMLSNIINGQFLYHRNLFHSGTVNINNLPIDTSNHPKAKANR